MINFDKLMSEIYATEEAIIPIFIHSPQTQKVTAVVIAGETALQELVDGFVAVFNSKKVVTPPTTTVTVSTPAAPVAAASE